jgi:starch synthase
VHTDSLVHKPESVKITVLSSYNVSRPSVWSGTPYHCVQALERTGTCVDVLCPATPDIPSEASSKFRQYASANQKYLWTRDLQLTKTILDALHKKMLARPETDWLLLFNPSDAAYLDTSIPISIVVDATWKQFVLSYSPFVSRQICRETYEDGCRGEALGFEKATLLLCLTEWAAAGIVHEYPEMEHKVGVVHPGANLAETIDRERVYGNISRRIRKPLNLLFMGVDPYRKGLDIAIYACEELRRTGIEAYLQVIGSEISVKTPPYVKVYGFLDKSKKKDLAALRRVYSNAFVLLLPARAECAGIVICEAAAFGVPAIVSGVGGTKELVRDGFTGYVTGVDSFPTEYANRIRFLLGHPASYMLMAKEARLRFETHLNWNTFIYGMLGFMMRSREARA